MRHILKHIVSQPFIASTAFAALLHSTWTLGTLFAGPQPPAEFSFQFLGWLIPALLIAFSLDIGLLATAGEIRAGQRTKAKYLTFGVLSMSMFYLQWVYLIAHTPSLNLAPGVSPTWRDIALVLRDAAIWIIPALLPLSTLLYTFSHTGPGVQEHPSSAALTAQTQSESITQESTASAPRIERRTRIASPAAIAERSAVMSSDGHQGADNGS